jgi:predicted transcriptional regulator
MKTKSPTPKFGTVHKVDKRQLVNLDLYKNEIRILQNRLNDVSQKHPGSPAAQKKIEKLNRDLKTQKENLEVFRQNYEVEEMVIRHSLLSMPTKKEATNTETFYEHLKSFEDEFKVIRQEVNEFIAKWC